ncbi:hypothetical protein C1H46_003047 [Malus baccata]|uniref:Uncharacterized protein n=1 Tax=Malus baccata TaxID=106549 RepID=A0A540NL00_MALBA|nr:hypothetical protein C1H46_003047 [Malus baccata]
MEMGPIQKIEFVPCKLLKTSQTTHTTTEKITITWDPQHRATATKEKHSALANAIGSVIMNNCPLMFTQWKSDLHKHYEKYDGLEVALAVRCPKELVDRHDKWEWFCGHFQYEKYLSFMGEKGQTVLDEIIMDTLDQTLCHKQGNVHRGLRKARLRDSFASSSRQRTKEVKLLTYEVANLKEQTIVQQSQFVTQSSLMNKICLALQISGIRFLNVEPTPTMTS